MTTISNSLNALCELLRAHTTVPVSLGLPRDDAEGLFVWPYRMMLTAQGAAPPSRIGNVILPRQTALEMPLLIVARPLDREGGFDALEAAMHGLMATPVISGPGGEVRVTFDSRLTITELASLFSAAGIAQGLALELSLRSTITAVTRPVAPVIESPPL